MYLGLHKAYQVFEVSIRNQQETGATVDDDLLVLSKNEFGIVDFGIDALHSHVLETKCPPLFVRLIDVMVHQLRAQRCHVGQVDASKCHLGLVVGQLDH